MGRGHEVGHAEVRSLPHRRSYGILGPQSQAHIATAVLGALGFETTPQAELEGLSGLKHHIPLLGIDQAHKRLIVVQGGAEEISRFFHERPQKPRPPRQPKEQILDWIQRSLFKTLDLREAIQDRGWSCNILYLFNSFETPTASMTVDEQSIWWQTNQLPQDLRITSLGAQDPIGSLDVDFIRARVISVGAAFLDANQLEIEELAQLSAPWSSATSDIASSVVARLRLKQFFQPPLDELLLGTLGKAGKLSLDDLQGAPAVAERSGHELAPNTIVKGVPTEDPIATLRQLESLGNLTFRRREVFIEESGKAVVQEWERTAQESLFVKIVRELRFPELLEAIIRGFRGGSP